MRGEVSRNLRELGARSDVSPWGYGPVAERDRHDPLNWHLLPDYGFQASSARISLLERQGYAQAEGGASAVSILVDDVPTVGAS
jgi:hypothetical protein